MGNDGFPKEPPAASCPLSGSLFGWARPTASDGWDRHRDAFVSASARQQHTFPGENGSNARHSFLGESSSSTRHGLSGDNAASARRTFPGEIVSGRDGYDASDGGRREGVKGQVARRVHTRPYAINPKPETQKPSTRKLQPSTLDTQLKTQNAKTINTTTQTLDHKP